MWADSAREGIEWVSLSLTVVCLVLSKDSKPLEH